MAATPPQANRPTRARAVHGIVALAWLLAAAPAARAQDAPPPDAAAAAPSADQPPAEPEPSAQPKQPAAQPVTQPQAVTIPAKLPEKDDDSVHLEKVIVTATKRAKSARDIPGSIGAIRGEDLEKMSAQGLKDYLKLVPGVSYADQGNEESVPIIRGVASDISQGATQLTTGVYLDDMPFADLFGAAAGSFPDINPFDLERVEVLKGPQGTLFGSGALAGAIRYIVEKPHFGQWEAKVSQTISRTKYSSGISPTTAAAVNVPIGSTFAIRAVGVFRKDAGLYDTYADQCTPGVPAMPPLPAIPPQCTGTKLRDDKDADRLKQTSARVLAAWQPFERFKVSAFYFGQKTHSNDLSWSDNPNTLQRGQAPFPSPRDHDFGGGNLSISYDFDWARLLSSTNRMTKHNYTSTHQEFGFGLGGQNQAEYVQVFGQDILGWTQEIRLSSPEASRGIFEWLVGGSYLYYHQSFWQFANIGPYLGDPTNVNDVTPERILLSQVFATAAELATEKALFGEITGRLGKHWEVTAGARRYQTGLTSQTMICGAQIVAFFQQQCYPQEPSLRSSGLNPKFSIRYIHNRHLQWYLLAAKGFQFGGIQVNPPAPGFQQSAEQQGFHFAPFKSSDLWNYESGIRTEWLDHRLRFDVGFFYLDWKDLQLTVAVNYLNTNLQFASIENVGRAHSAGIETSLEAIPFSGARWVTSATWINAVTDVPFDEANQAGPVAPGTRLPGTPRFQIANVFSYEHALPIFSGWSAGPAITHSHIGVSPDAIRATGTVGGYDTIDVRIAAANRRSRFVPEISVGVTNLFDVRGVTYHLRANSATTGEPFDFYHFVQPRTVITNFSLRFGQ